MKCRFIDTKIGSAEINMAIDEALTLLCTGPILRFYEWNPSVSIGYNQSTKEINLEYCKNNNISIVRRITGGKAVFHDKELTYSFMIPKNCNVLSEDLIQSYKQISEALVLGIEKIGIKTTIKKMNEKIKSEICFNSSNWYELKINEKKIAGSAQRRLNGKILQHGSILLDFDYGKNSKIFNYEIESLKNNITSIKNESNENVDIEKLKKEIKNGFKEKFGFKFTQSELNKEEKKLARELREKYFVYST